MKKILNVCLILLSILWVFLITFLVLTGLRVEGFAKYCISAYGDFTNNYGYTVEQFYDKFGTILMWSCIVTAILTIVAVIWRVVIWKQEKRKEESNMGLFKKKKKEAFIEKVEKATKKTEEVANNVEAAANTTKSNAAAFLQTLKNKK